MRVICTIPCVCANSQVLQTETKPFAHMNLNKHQTRKVVCFAKFVVHTSFQMKNKVLQKFEAAEYSMEIFGNLSILIRAYEQANYH